MIHSDKDGLAGCLDSVLNFMSFTGGLFVALMGLTVIVLWLLGAMP